MLFKSGCWSKPNLVMYPLLFLFLFSFNVSILKVGFPDSSVGKESTCNTGDPSSIPGSERSPGEGIGYPLQYSCGSTGKESACNEGDMGSIPGLGRSPGEGKSDEMRNMVTTVNNTVLYVNRE